MSGQHEIVAILWEDHYSGTGELPKNGDDLVERPTLSIGALVSETDKTYLVVHEVERYATYEHTSYTVILKSAVVGIKKYGSIEIDLSK